MVDPATVIGGINAAANIASAGSNFFGGGGLEGLSRDDQRYLAHQNMSMALRNEDVQRDLVHRSIQIRAKDAEAAGLHPLAALGISPASNSFSANVGGNPSSGGPELSDRIRAMSQDISRASAAVASPYERAAQAQALQTGELQNQLLQEQLIGARWENTSKVGPPTPLAAHQDMRNADGSVSRQPSQAWADANQNSFLARLEWMLSNKLMPNMPRGSVPPRRSTSTWRWGDR